MKAFVGMLLKHTALRLLDSVLRAFVRLQGYISFQAAGLSSGDVVLAGFCLILVVLASRRAEPISLLSAFDCHYFLSVLENGIRTTVT